MAIRFGVLLSLVILGPLTAPAAQDLIYYKFEAGGGRKVVNYVPPTTKAATEGTIIGNLADPDIWSDGRFGAGGLKGLQTAPRSPYVDTGWDQAFSGDITFAFFFRVRSVVPTRSGTSVFGGGHGSPGIEAVLGRAQDNRGLFIGGLYGFSGGEIILTKDILTPAYSRWVHVGVTLDGTAKAGRFYVDGNPETPFALSRVPNMFRSPWNLRVGADDCYVDLDEFRVSLRVASPAEFNAWATQDHAADGIYGTGCGPLGGPTLDATGRGLARIGNAGYGYNLVGFPQSPFGVGVGPTRLALGPLTLPLDLGALNPAWAGCVWQSGSVVWLSGTLDATGKSMVPLPIPNDPNLVGAALYSQANMIYPVAQLVVSNAIASSVGH